MKLFQKKAIQKIVAGCMLAAMLLSDICIGGIRVFAYEEKTGMICRDDGELTITRVEPTDSSDKVSGLEYGKPVTVLDEVTAGGELWYKVSYTLKSNGSVKTGYCPAKYVLLDENAVVFANGTVTADNVYVRNDAGTYGTYMLVALNKGHALQLLTQTTVSGEVWYRVRCEAEGVTYIGWVLEKYVNINEYVYEEDEDYEEHLRNIGFPESYIDSLMMMHSKYPEWQFVPILTGLDWNAAVKAESASAVNMVQTSADDAKKSVASTEYNWNTNQWVIRDGTGWVTAHPDYIAYCMDPRNFLNETNVFMFECLSYSASHSAAGVLDIIAGTFMVGDGTGFVKHSSDGTTINYVDTFMEIAKNNNVSAYHLASRIRQEQGANGTSPLISGTYAGYEGLYNYFNIGAYGTGNTLYINGLKRARAEGWTSRYLSLNGGAAFIAKNYISVGQDTLYFQKFNVVYEDKLYRHQYMANVTAAITEGKKMGEAYTNRHQAFVFEIPVYNNMPAEPVTFTATGSRNNYLSSLTASGISITPAFQGGTTSYSAVVDYGVSSITIGAKAVVGSATITGTGTYDLNVGTNKITIQCESATGDVRNYTLTIVRQEKQDDVSGDEGYTLNSENYKFGDYITGVQPKTTSAEMISNITCEGCEVKVLTANGEERTDAIATGDKLAVYVNDTMVSVYEIVIYGDVNGDGEIRMTDMAKVNRHMLGLSALSGAYLEAADVNHDGKVRMTDMAVINRHMLGLATIEQLKEV